MDIEASLMKFVTTVIKHNQDDNSQKYNDEQANLIETFSYSIVGRIHPKVFEKNIIDNKMKLNFKEKNCYVKISLNPVQILYFKLLYNLAYIKRFYPTKISNLKLSEDLGEMLNDEKKIISIYNEVNKIVLN